MSNHHKEQEQGIGSELIGIPDALINLIIKNAKKKEWALDEVANKGPEHKQVYSALLLKRMHELVQSIAKQTGKSFTPQRGASVMSHKDEIEIPVPLVLKGLSTEDQEAVTEVVRHSPPHESIAFNSLLQAIEWSITALDRTSE